MPEVLTISAVRINNIGISAKTAGGVIITERLWSRRFLSRSLQKP